MRAVTLVSSNSDVLVRRSPGFLALRNPRASACAATTEATTATASTAPTMPDRKSVVQGKSVDLGGRRIIKKKKRTPAAGPGPSCRAERNVGTDGARPV